MPSATASSERNPNSLSRLFVTSVASGTGRAVFLSPASVKRAHMGSIPARFGFASAICTSAEPKPTTLDLMIASGDSGALFGDSCCDRPDDPAGVVDTRNECPPPRLLSPRSSSLEDVDALSMSNSSTESLADRFSTAPPLTPREAPHPPRCLGLLPAETLAPLSPPITSCPTASSSQLTCAAP